ncbi:MAG: ABC transporter ATP-binding protein [Gammaproteobacteria bacterium]|nr:ABC transporter ATP-binding protein [Gammaproteobacteria bacterium]
MFDDANYDDGFDELALAKRVRLSLWKKLFAYTRPYRREVILLAGFAVLTALVDVSFPLITRGVIDAVDAHGLEANLWPYAFAYFAATTLLSASVGGFIWAGGKIRTHVSYDIRRDGFENLQRLSFSFYDFRPVGWLMARMTSDCERLSNILAWGILDFVWGVTMMVGIAVAMLVMNVKLALLVLTIIPILLWVSAKFQKRILGSAREVRRTNSRITASYNESIMGVLTSKAFVRESANLDEFRGLTNGMYDASVRNLTLAAIYVPIVLTLASLATGLALAVGGFDLLVGVISVGTLIAFMAYTRHFFDPVEQLGRWFAELQMAQASAERIMSLVEAVPDIRDSAAVQEALARNRDLPPRQHYAEDGGAARIGSIEVKAMSFAYGNGTPVLHDINFAVTAGETIALVGPTGGGKSTLVNVICRFYEPTSGSVLIDGVDYRSRGLHWLQSNLGMVLQQAHVFSGTIRDNIRYGKLAASDEEIVQAATTAGAHGFILEMEKGYDTEVGEAGSKLSAGQKQLVSFARAILANPQILVMDEATSSVDTETESRIQQGLEAVLANRISFVIAHRLSTIRNASRILVVEGGRITEAGTHAQLMALRGHYFELYRQQSLNQTTRELSALNPRLA